VALSLGMGQRFTIETPLMWLDKAQTWALARTLGGDALVDMIVEHTHTCYLGERGQRTPGATAAATCPACALRRKGFERWMGGSEATQFQT
jgi:7-cyano-7-deazaguanine synthase